MFLFQVFGAQAEAHAAELGPCFRVAAALRPQRKRSRGPDLRLQRGHHAPATRLVWKSGGSLRASYLTNVDAGVFFPFFN